jgi:hypothetical protein
MPGKLYGKLEAGMKQGGKNKLMLPILMINIGRT